MSYTDYFHELSQHHCDGTGPYWRKVNIGSGDGLVPSGNKPLPEPMLTKICHNIASLVPDGLMSMPVPGTCQAGCTHFGKTGSNTSGSFGKPEVDNFEHYLRMMQTSICHNRSMA